MARAKSSLPVPLGAFDEDGALAGGDIGQDGEDLVDFVILADDVADGVAAADLAAEQLDIGKIAESLDAAYDRAGFIAQGGRADADWNLSPFAIQDGYADIHKVLAGVDGAMEDAVRLTHVGAENVEAFLAGGLLPWNAGDLLRRAIEGRDIPVEVNREHAVRNRIEDDVSVGRAHGPIMPGWRGEHLLRDAPTGRRSGVIA